MNPSDLIKGNTYIYTYDGKQYESVYIRHTLNYRVFRCGEKEFQLSESAAKQSIIEK